MSTLISIGGAVRGGRGRPAPVVSAHRSAMRVVERTTTTIREIYVDDPAPRTTAPDRPTVETIAEATGEIRGLDRAVVRLGLWLVRLGRRRAAGLRPHADSIAERLDATKSHNARFGFGATTYLG